MKPWKEVLKEATIVTLLSVNLSLGAVILVRDVVPVDDSVPSLSENIQPNIQTEYVMELVETKKSGDYRIETYQEFEVQYDAEGKQIKRTPTNKVEYIPYYTGN